MAKIVTTITNLGKVATAFIPPTALYIIIPFTGLAVFFTLFRKVD